MYGSGCGCALPTALAGQRRCRPGRARNGSLRTARLRARLRRLRARSRPSSRRSRLPTVRRPARSGSSAGSAGWIDCAHVDHERQRLVLADDVTASPARRMRGRCGMSSWTLAPVCAPSEALVPAGNHAALSEYEGDGRDRRSRLARVVAVVELDAVTRPDADVVDDAPCRRLRPPGQSLPRARSPRVRWGSRRGSRPRACRDCSSVWPASCRRGSRRRWPSCPRSTARVVGRIRRGLGGVVAGSVVVARARREQQGGGHEQGEGPAHCDDANLRSPTAPRQPRETLTRL